MESTGCQTQVSGLVSGLVLLLVLLLIAPLFYSLQKCVLAVIIVVNLRGALQKFTDLPRMWRVNRLDAAVWLVTMATSALVNTELGLLVGVMASALCVLGRTQRAQVRELGRTKAGELYEELAEYGGLQTHPGVLVCRYAAPIYYANQSLFKASLYRRAGLDPVQEVRRLRFQKQSQQQQEGAGAPGLEEGGAAVTLVTSPRCFHSLVIDCSAVLFLDTAGGGGAQKRCAKDYGAVGIRVVLAPVQP
uniref:STAS domain-containing protein n=1 Tax=Tetraodon nigroviridis TaxID=99883 RepID=H3C833_TETNG